jgi:hypothetical protein
LGGVHGGGSTPSQGSAPAHFGTQKMPVPLWRGKERPPTFLFVLILILIFIPIPRPPRRPKDLSPCAAPNREPQNACPPVGGGGASPNLPLRLNPNLNLHPNPSPPRRPKDLSPCAAPNREPQNACPPVEGE